MHCFWWRQSLRGKGLPHARRGAREGGSGWGGQQQSPVQLPPCPCCAWPWAPPTPSQTWPWPGSWPVPGCHPQQLPGPGHTPTAGTWHWPPFCSSLRLLGRMPSISFNLLVSELIVSVIFRNENRLFPSNQPSCSLLSEHQRCHSVMVHTRQLPINPPFGCSSHIQVLCFSCTFATARTFSILLSLFPFISHPSWVSHLPCVFFSSSLLASLSGLLFCVSETWILIQNICNTFSPCLKLLCR